MPFILKFVCAALLCATRTVVVNALYCRCAKRSLDQAAVMIAGVAA